MRISDWSSDVCSSDLCRGVSITAAGKASRSTSQWSGSAGGRTNASASSSGVRRLIEEGLQDLMIVDRTRLLEMMRRGVEYVQLPALHHPGPHHRIVRGQARIRQSPDDQRRDYNHDQITCQVLPI